MQGIVRMHTYCFRAWYLQAAIYIDIPCLHTPRLEVLKAKHLACFAKLPRLPLLWVGIEAHAALMLPTCSELPLRLTLAVFEAASDSPLPAQRRLPAPNCSMFVHVQKCCTQERDASDFAGIQRDTHAACHTSTKYCFIRAR